MSKSFTHFRCFLCGCNSKAGNLAALCPQGEFSNGSVRNHVHLRSDLGDELVDQAINKYQTLLKDQGAEAIETQHRGKRRLAYEINRQREGIYVQMNYAAPGTAIAALERSMRLSDDVIRFLTIKPEAPAASSADEE